MSGTGTCIQNRSNIARKQTLWCTENQSVESCRQFILIQGICIKGKSPSKRSIIKVLMHVRLTFTKHTKTLWAAKAWRSTNLSSRPLPKHCGKAGNVITPWQHRLIGKAGQLDDNCSCSTRQKLCRVNQKLFLSSSVNAIRIILVLQDYTLRLKGATQGQVQ